MSLYFLGSTVVTMNIISTVVGSTFGAVNGKYDYWMLSDKVTSQLEYCCYGPVNLLPGEFGVVYKAHLLKVRDGDDSQLLL